MPLAAPLLRLVAVLTVGLLAAAALTAPALAQPEDDDDTTGTLEGTVTGATGDPVAGAVVLVVAVSDEEGCPAPDPACPEPVEVEADDEGFWELGDLEAGDYHLHVSDPTGEHAHQWVEDRAEPVDVVAVDEGETVTIDVSLDRAAVAQVTVADDRGEAVAGALLAVAITPFATVTATTDAQGEGSLAGLRPGGTVMTVTPEHAGLAPADVTVTLEAGDNAVEVVTELVAVEVQRVAGRNRVETAVAASRHAFDTAETVVIADARSFPDALAAAPLAAHVEGPLLLVAGPVVAPEVLAELERLEATSAVLVGATGAIPYVAQRELDRAGLDVRRIAGENRFDTAALIARELGAPDGEVLVASGATFADALSVAPIAARQGLPILLALPEGPLPAETAEVIGALEVARATVIGGAAAVSDEAFGQLPDPVRVAGSERYATSAAVAQLAVERGMGLATVHLATGADFPDALAAGPVAARADGPLLLVASEDPQASAAALELLDARAAHSGALVAFGGTAAIADPVLDAAAAAASGGAR